jgi:two-component system phosphate regulon sensor histidine kinase PhoR
VRGNEALLEQLVYNLLDNAARYSVDGGRVRVRIARTGDTVTLAVDDDGPGVEEEYRERIFERFFRVDESRSRETGGTGLGLAIVKHAAEAHGGTVHVEESEWGGASFVVELPAAVG